VIVSQLKLNLNLNLNLNPNPSGEAGAAARPAPITIHYQNRVLRVLLGIGGGLQITTYNDALSLARRFL